MRCKLTAVLTLVSLATLVMGLDWHTWRGPDASSISKETGWNPAAIKSGAKILWSADLGEGYSAVSVKDGKLYTMGNIEKNDIIYCFDAVTGKTVWTYKYPCDDGSYPGPRATPVIDGNRLYTMSRDGDLICLQTADGKKVWSKKVITEYKASNIQWGLASSVVVNGDMLLINAGSTGMALKKKDGSLIWGKPGAGNYTTPVLFTRKGEQQAVIADKAGINVVRVKDGTVLASFPWDAKYNIIAADPVVMGDLIHFSTAYDVGGATLKYDGKSLKPVWKGKQLRSHFTSPVLIDGYLYGADGNAGKKSSMVTCVEMKTGTVKWSAPLGFSNLMVANGRLIIIEEHGQLYIADAKPDKYTEIASAKVLDEKNCWTMPVLANGIIYCRNSPGKLVAVDVRK